MGLYYKDYLVDGMVMAGTLIIDIDRAAVRYVLPKQATCCTLGATGMRSNKESELIVKNVKLFNKILRNITLLYYLPEKIFINDPDEMIDEDCFRRSRFMSSSIEFSSDNKQYVSKDGIICTKDMKRLISYTRGGAPRTHIQIPYGVEKIEEKAFCEDTKIESVEIPDSVKKIGDMAFERCSSLKTVKMS